MRKLKMLLAVLLLLAPVAACSEGTISGFEGSVTGLWLVSGGPYEEFTLNLSDNGGGVSGTWRHRTPESTPINPQYAQGSVTGTNANPDVTLTLQGSGMTFQGELLEEGAMAGVLTVNGTEYSVGMTR